VPITKRITGFNRRFVNPLTRRLAGHGSMVELEHVGRTSGATYRTPLMAFRDGGTVTIALTYGADVQWLKNVTAAGGGRIRIRGEVLRLGAPRRLPEAEALRRMPYPQKALLRWPIRCHDYVELPVLPAS
jgi:deazaflavin-dependent oxidoreductase (nitroreductase family)